MSISTTKKKNCNAYLIYETGKEPVLELQMYNQQDNTRCLLKRYYDTSNHLISLKIFVPQLKLNNKKCNENENEYKSQDIKRISMRCKPVEIANLSHWSALIQFYNKGRNWTHIQSYNGKFKVKVYQNIMRKEVLIIFWNEYDCEIQLFVI